MVNWGNPPNMGICAACFIRDIAGALGLHSAAVVQYIRPEIIGFILGAFLTSFAFREFRARGGASPMIRFMILLPIPLAMALLTTRMCRC